MDRFGSVIAEAQVADLDGRSAHRGRRFEGSEIQWRAMGRAMVLAMGRENSIPRGLMVFLAQVEGFQTLDQERLEFGIWNLQVMGLYNHRVERLGQSA